MNYEYLSRVALAQGGPRLSYVPWVKFKLLARLLNDWRERPQGSIVEISAYEFVTPKFQTVG